MQVIPSYKFHVRAAETDPERRGVIVVATGQRGSLFHDPKSGLRSIGLQLPVSTVVRENRHVKHVQAGANEMKMALEMSFRVMQAAPSEEYAK